MVYYFYIFISFNQQNTTFNYNYFFTHMTKQKIIGLNYKLGARQILCIIFLIVFSLLFSTPNTFAQEDVTPNDTTNLVVEDAQPTEQQTSVEATQDSNVTLEDLEVDKGAILPNSPFYGFKRFGRNLKETFTFNKVKKQKVRLENANKELAEANMLFEQSPEDEKAIQAVNKSILHYENKIGQVKDTINDLKEQKQAGNSNVEELLDYTLDRQIKHQKILNNIENKLSKNGGNGLAPKLISTIQKTKNNTANYVGEILGGVEDNNENLAIRLDRVLDKQKGSDFKEIRNLEIIHKIKQGVPEDRKQAFNIAEGKSLERFSEHVHKLPPKERVNNFNKYIKNVQGDELQHFRIFDQLKQRGELPTDIKEHLDSAKDVVAHRFQEQIEDARQRYDEDAGRQMIQDRFAGFQDGGADFKKMRVIEDIRHRINFEDDALQEEMAQEKEKAIATFKEAFPDAQKDAEKFKELSKQMTENPDPTTFRLIKELEKKVKADPKKRAFLQDIEKATKHTFVKRFKEKGDDFFNEIISANPKDIETIKGLQQDFINNPDHFMKPPPRFDPEFDPNLDPNFDPEFDPNLDPRFDPEFDREFDPGFDPELDRTPPIDPNSVPPDFRHFFDRAVEKQTKHFVERIDQINDPKQLENFQRRLEAQPNVFREIKFQQKDFQIKLKERGRRIKDEMFDNIRDEGFEERFDDRRDRPEERKDGRFDKIIDETPRDMQGPPPDARERMNGERPDGPPRMDDRRNEPPRVDDRRDRPEERKDGRFDKIIDETPRDMQGPPPGGGGMQGPPPGGM